MKAKPDQNQKANAGVGAPVTANFGWSKICGQISDRAFGPSSPKGGISDNGLSCISQNLISKSLARVE
ncbi:MAG TPA: hypothetical protein VJT54_08915 [Verrucomicrobiae bacterium]|nr:hypothetical protein [Verrucomicrobiae bacterium]